MGAVIPVSSKGDKVALPAVVSSKRNLIPAEECSTIFNSDIPSDWISELFSDTLSWPENWADSDDEPPCDTEEDEVLSVQAANVKIELSTSAAPRLCLIGSLEEERWANWVPKIVTSKPIHVTRSCCKPDTVAGHRVHRASNTWVLPGCGDPKNTAQAVQVTAHHYELSD